MTIDLDALEALARGAVRGPWEADSASLTVGARVHTLFPGDTFVSNYDDLYRYGAPHADSDLYDKPVPVWDIHSVPATIQYIAAANPVVVLELIERLRAAEASASAAVASASAAVASASAAVAHKEVACPSMV